MNSMERSIRNYAKLHPDDPLSGYVLRELAESAAKKKAEVRRWKKIADELFMFSSTPETETEKILSYFDKIRELEVLWCESHDREFLLGEECPGCLSERRDFLQSMKAKPDYDKKNLKIGRLKI